jgi:excisionase family DNA binding protein
VGVHAEATSLISPALAKRARAHLQRLDPVIRSLEAAGQAEDAAAVRLAKRLAERALGQEQAPPLLTTRQAGRVLGVSIQTIRNWADAGRLRTERRGTRTMVPRQAVMNEIERSRARPTRTEPDDDAILARRKRLLASLPRDVVEPLNQLHERLEAGEDLTADELGRMIELEDAMAAAAARAMEAELRELQSRPTSAA